MSEVAPVIPAGAMTRTGLRLTDPNMPIEQAARIGVNIADGHKAFQWAIGDYLIFIETTYPNEWTQLAELLGVSEEKRIEYRRVSEKVPHSVRRENVDWSHHRAVAALKVVDSATGKAIPDHKAQKQWLEKVEDEGLSHAALRDALRNGSEPIVQHSCRCCGRAYDA